MKTESAIISKTISIKPNSKKTFSIIDINENNVDMDIIVNLYEKSEVILNLSTFAVSANKNYNIYFNHLSDNSKSDCNVFGVAKNSSNINFKLTSNIAFDSMKNFCNQSIRGILLSNDSSIIGSPNLIIDTNSIQAKHSLSIGKVKESQIFYLESRGLSKIESIFILIMSYFNICLNKIKNESNKIKLEQKIKDNI